MNGLQMLCVAAGVVLVAQSFGLFDFSKVPLIGPILTAIGVAKTPKTVAVVVKEDDAAADERCAELLAAVTTLQHFSSERPVERALECLKACQTLREELAAYHKEHEHATKS